MPAAPVCLFTHSLQKDLCQALPLTGRPRPLDLQAGREMHLEASPGTKHGSNQDSPGLAVLSTPGTGRGSRHRAGDQMGKPRCSRGARVR